MENFHNHTNHSYKSVRQNAFYLDWRTQPQNHKKYPKFHQRFKIDDIEQLRELDLIGGITFEKQYPEGIYSLRTNPSAGALYPCEIYIQVRGVKGLLEGIYHYEPHSKSLTLLHELTTDGVEYCFKDQKRQKGIVFLISTVYFRSSWKYRNRAIRYILLDSGHQLGSIYAALTVMGKKDKIVFDFDKLLLNEQFGFRDDEMFTCALCSTDHLEKDTQKLKLQLPYVSATDYSQRDEFIEKAYEQTALYSDNTGKVDFFEGINKKELKNTILQRRSLRAFSSSSIQKDQFEFIVKGIFEFGLKHNIEIYYTLHNVKDKAQGLYKGADMMAEGDFSQRSRYLGLEQNLAGQSAVTFYFTSNENVKYQKVNILSGFIAHIIYLRSELRSIGCSGIGAYYDDEVKEFLKTKNNILYMVAIGR